MIVFYLIVLIFNFLNIFTQDAPGGTPSSVPGSPTGTQSVNAINNTVTTVTPATAITQPNMQIRTPDTSAISSSSNAISTVSTPEIPYPLKAPDEAKPKEIIDDKVANSQAFNSVNSLPVKPDNENNSFIENRSIQDPTLNLPSSVPQQQPLISNTANESNNGVSLQNQPEKANPEKPSSSTSLKSEALVTTNPIKTDSLNLKENPKTKKENQEVMSSINTLDVEEEGNWLLKRVWWEQSEQTFEKIISLNDDVTKLQIDYISKRSELDKKLSQLFSKLGFEQGEISQALEYFLHQLSIEREAQGLASSQKELFNTLNNKKEDIQKIQTDLNTLTHLDVSVDDVINQLVQQVNKSREFEKNAWQDFKEIGRVLNDKKAKELFYQIEADLKSIQNIQTYLNIELKKYFQDLLDNVDKTANSIVTKINNIETETGSLKDQFENLQRQEELQKQNELENQLKKQSQVKKEQAKKQKSWISNFWDKLTSFF